METMISQIRQAMESKLYYVALMATLAIPDIAGALSSEDGHANQTKYIDWYETWVRPRLIESRGRENPFTGQACYWFRCSMLHQGSSQDPKSRTNRVIFIEPGAPNYSIHYCLIGNEVLLIQLDAFIEEALSGCELWLSSEKNTERFKRNFARFAAHHSNGLAPYVIGVPVVG